MADPTNAELVSFLAQGFKPHDLNRVGRTLRAEIQERVDQVAGKASVSGATFTGAVTFTSTASVSGVFTAASGVKFTLSDFADDTAAASGGIAVGQLYRNGSVVQVRVS